MFGFIIAQTNKMIENTSTNTYTKIQIPEYIKAPAGNRWGDFHDAELVGTLTTPGNQSLCAVAWDGEYYYSSQQGDPDGLEYIYRHDEQFNIVDQQLVELYITGIVQNPADEKLYIKDYPSNSLYRLNTDPFDGSVEFIFEFSIFGELQLAGFTFSADGQYVIVNDRSNLYKFEFSTGNFVENFFSPYTGSRAIANTGTYLLVPGDFTGQVLSAYDIH